METALSRTLTVIAFMCSILLAVTYFVPVEASWSPYDAWQGYFDANGNFSSGFNVGLVEVFPYTVGIIVALSLIFIKWARLCILVTSFFATAWILSGIVQVWGIVFVTPPYRLPALWAGLAVLFIPSIAAVLIFTVLKCTHARAVTTVAMVLTASSIISQSCSVAWYLLEDGLLLNVGAVTGMTSAVTLFVVRMIRRQLIVYVDTSNQSIQDTPLCVAS